MAPPRQHRIEGEGRGFYYAVTEREDALWGQVLRANAAPLTFLDKMRLETGGNFVRDFSSALGKTRIAVVLVSAAALERMTAERLDPARDVRPQPPLARRRRNECIDDSILEIVVQPYERATLRHQGATTSWGKAPKRAHIF